MTLKKAVVIRLRFLVKTSDICERKLNYYVKGDSIYVKRKMAIQI